MVVYKIIETNVFLDEADDNSRNTIGWTKDIDEAYDFFRLTAIEKEKADIDDENKTLVTLEKHFVYPDGDSEEMSTLESKEIKGDE